MFKFRKPLLPPWRYWPAVTLVLLIGIAAYGAWQTELLSPPIENSRYAKTYEKSNSNGPPSDLGPRLVEFWDWITKDSISFFTAILAVFTGALLWVAIVEIQYLRRAERITARLAVIARRQMAISGQQTDVLIQQKEIARKEFTAAHRPHIRVRRIDDVKLFPSIPITATIEAANIGITKAKITGAGVDIFLRPVASRRNCTYGASSGDIKPITVPPGKVGKISIQATHVPTATDVANFNAGVLELCAIGILNYEDMNGAGRSTSFFRVFDLNGKRFVPRPTDPWEGDREFEE